MPNHSIGSCKFDFVSMKIWFVSSGDGVPKCDVPIPTEVVQKSSMALEIDLIRNFNGGNPPAACQPASAVLCKHRCSFKI